VLSVNSVGEESAPQGGPGFRPSHRLVVGYSADAPVSAPAQLYVKLGDGRSDSQAGRQEWAFYAKIAASMADPPSVPCYAAAYDAEMGAYHLLLEDVSETHFLVEREAPASKVDTEQMIDLLARFHAHWWGQAGLEDAHDWVDKWFIQDSKALDFAGFVDFMGDRLSDERRHIYEQVLDRLPGLLTQRLDSRQALTIVHDDTHVWNFMLPRDPARDPVYLVDWQQWGASAGPHDVAYMIALFWYPERRKRMEWDLVRRYHARLLEQGVTGYAWDACWWDYRLFVIRSLLVPFWAWAFSFWGYHRWSQMEKAMLAFQDLNCGELLER
jgi:hypothetical protein